MTRLGLVAMVLAGCTRVESDDILTSGMYADISARAKGDGTTTVSATLMLGNPANLNFVDLTADDQLIASHGDQAKVMTEIIILNAVGHSATFQADAEGDEFVVDFQRTIDNGAPESIATLPAPFAIAGGASTVSRAAALTIDWSAGSPDLMKWSATGDCIDSAGAELSDDTGSTTIAPGTFEKRQGTMIADSCTVTVTLTRSRLGDLDPGYGEGGFIAGAQERTFQLTSTP